VSVLLVALLAASALVVGCTTASSGAPFGQAGPGMMGGNGSANAGPGSPGFVAGTTEAPRVVRIVAGPGYTFMPSRVRVAAGETITFAVTTMGPMVHEFKVGPLDVVRADGDAPEITEIGMMQTKTLTYTFAGTGPFGYACHQPGHFEGGMWGTIAVVG
jgi:uncharacterized cupredoxin-like copper-binding protein